MSRPSDVTLEMAEQFALMRDAVRMVRAEGPTALAVGALFAGALVADDLYRAGAAADPDDLRHEASYQEFRRLALLDLLPALEDHFLAALVLSEGLPPPRAGTHAGPVDLARCLMALGLLLQQPQGSARLGLELLRRVESHGRAMRRILQAPEPADLPSLAANQRVIDEMLAALEVLGDGPSAVAIRQHSRVLARAALGRVTTTLETFLAKGDLNARFDMATVLAAADDLLVVARRVIEGVGEEYDPLGERYADNLGMETLRRFAAAILAIEQQTLRNSLTAVEKAQVSPELFEASLLMLVKLRGLGRSILDGASRSAATAEARAAERAEQLLRPAAMVQGVDYAARQMDRVLAERTRDGSERAARLDAYAAVFEDFKRRAGLTG